MAGSSPCLVFGAHLSATGIRRQVLHYLPVTQAQSSSRSIRHSLTHSTLPNPPESPVAIFPPTTTSHGLPSTMPNPLILDTTLLLILLRTVDLMAQSTAVLVVLGLWFAVYEVAWGFGRCVYGGVLKFG